MNFDNFSYFKRESYIYTLLKYLRNTSLRFMNMLMTMRICHHALFLIASRLCVTWKGPNLNNANYFRCCRDGADLIL